MRTTTMSSMKTTTRTMTENKRHHPRVANERRKGGRREKSNSFVQRVSILDDADTEENEQLDELVSRRIKKSRSTGRLDLTGLDLTEFPMEIFDVTNDDAPLTDLQISNNRIYHIPDEIGDLQLLERLGLAGNRLTKLPESVGKLKRLQGLWAHGNLLRAYRSPYAVANLCETSPSPGTGYESYRKIFPNSSLWKN